MMALRSATRRRGRRLAVLTIAAAAAFALFAISQGGRAMVGGNIPGAKGGSFTAGVNVKGNGSGGLQTDYAGSLSGSPTQLPSQDRGRYL